MSNRSKTVALADHHFYVGALEHGVDIMISRELLNQDPELRGVVAFSLCRDGGIEFARAILAAAGVSQ